MTTFKRCLLRTCSATLLAAPGISALAVGFRLPNQDPEGIARGNAFAATADNASAIYYNPAGITQLPGDTFSVGAYFVSAGIDYTSPTGATAKAKSDFQPVPEIYYVHKLKDSQFSLGLGVYSPYGLSVDWGQNSPFSTLAQKGQVIYGCFNPVIAWQIHPTLSLAIGPTINYSEAMFQQAFPLTPNGTFHFRGDGTGYGFNAGLRWQPIEQLAFGMNYRSETEIEYDGSTEIQGLGRTPTHGPLRYPQFVVAGVSYRPTQNWNFEVNIDWTDWERVNDIVFQGTPLGQDVTLPLNLKSSFMYEFGVTRQLGNGYFGSVGYFYSENSSPSEFFNPILPDSNLQLGSIGFGHRGKRWDWAAAYHFGYNGVRDVKGSPTSAFGQSADGKYETLNQAFNISVAFKF